MAHKRTGSCHLLARAALRSSIALLLVAGTAMASEGKLVLLPDPKLLSLMILLFAVLIVPVNALLFKPIFRVLEDRNEKIDGTLKRAQRLGIEAAETLSRYNEAIREVRDEIEATRKENLSTARDHATERIHEARGAAEGEIERARREVQATLEEARATVRAQAEKLAGQAAERVLGRPLT